MAKDNLFDAIPKVMPDELFETLAESKNTRIERIISHGHSSPPGFCYDQDQNEWVILLRGSACLSFPTTGATKILRPGDYLNIPAHVKHRVDWTATDQPTVWLAVHYS